MELAVFNKEGEDTGKKVSFDEAVFGINPNDHAIYLDVKRIMKNRRQGTSKAKERAEIKGSTRKIKRQKGTGTARAGSLKSPIFRTGGRIFGPRPQSYDNKLNKQVIKLARKSALSYKLKDKVVTVLEEFNMDRPKTKSYVDMLNKLQLNSKKSLFIVSEQDNNLFLSCRNIPNTRLITCDQVTTYDIMDAHHIVIGEKAIEKVQQILG